MKARILLADDDKEVPAELGAALVSENYEVIVATDGRDAIDYWAFFLPAGDPVRPYSSTY